MDVKITDSKGIRLAKAYRPNTNKLLGFLRFVQAQGIIELTIFDSHLSFESLNLGGQNNPKIAYDRPGTFESQEHNEASAASFLFKPDKDRSRLAAFTLVRNEFQFRYKGSSCNWNFIFGNNKCREHLGLAFQCPIRPVKARKLLQLREDFTHKFPPKRDEDLTHYTFKDVCL
jgi:hypothetical protein